MAPTWVARRLAAAPGPVLFVTVALAYLALAELMMWVGEPIADGASLWPAAGVTLAALLMVPDRRWGWVLAATAFAEMAGDLAWGYPVVVSAGWALANTVEPLVGAFLLRRSDNPHGDLAPVRPLLLFLAYAVLVGPVVGAVAAAATSAATGISPFVEVLPNYFIGDALGVLVVAPLLLSSRQRRRRSRREVAALVVASVLVMVSVFGDVGGTWIATMPYLIIPFLAWAALRFGTFGTAWMALGITAVGNLVTTSGRGPFVLAAGSEGDGVALLQVFLGSTVASALLLAAVVSDLHDRREMEALLRHQATHDPLTGLANRIRLAEDLDAAFTRAAETGSPVGLLVCDLDGFKSVNDRVGHGGGDQLLVQVAQRLLTGVRPEDLVARISGDEFVVLLRDVDEAAITRVARRVAETVARPTLLNGRREVHPSVSVGAAVAQPGDSPDGLFQLADAALYEAKRRGRGRVVLADAELRLRTSAEQGTEAHLAAAFDDDQFVCHFQPVVDLGTGRIAAAEAVVRWRHPTLGLLDADRFLPIVEGAGLGDKLFETVLAQALRAQESWLERTGRRLPVSVNVSALQLSGGGVVNVVLRALAETDAQARALSLEVSQDTPLDDLGAASLHQLHALGLSVVLDGYGAGWSSMTQLLRTPWDLLKIDRSLVSEVGRDPGQTDLVRAIAAMARVLDIRLAADGVARIAQLETLTSLGCRLAQGSLFCRPQTSAELAQMLLDDRVWALPTGGDGRLAGATER